MEMIFSIYNDFITESHKNFIKNHISHKYEKWPTYRKWFFEKNPGSSEEEYYSWMAHRSGNQWEVDITWMKDEEFQYYWPVHYTYIMDIATEEE